MTSIVKPVLFSGLCVGCLALGGGAETPAPTPPAATPLPPPALFQPAQGAVAGQGGYGGLSTTVVGDRWYVHGYGAADAEALKLARQIADAKTDADKDKLRDKMKDVLDKAFEERQKRHEKEIEALEAQIKKLKSMVDKRKENKREIIDERVKQLQREASGLGW